MHTLPSVAVPHIGTVCFRLQSHSVTMSENLQHHYTFDRAGRLLTSFLDGVNYRRGLDSSILGRQVREDGEKLRHRLSETEKQALITHVQTRVAAIADYATAHLHPELPAQVAAISTWDYDRLRDEQTAFQQVYKPISILPPDQYRAVVLQAAEGCSWNKCSFCTFYRDRKFRIKSPGAFRTHIQQVKALLGSTIGLRKSLFLGDANALIIPQARLRAMLEVIHEEFALDADGNSTTLPLKGIYSFLDIFGAERKTLADYRELRERGLKRIYIGLETGDDELFALLRKPGSPQVCVEAVQTIKQAGLAVGVIVLAGAGGDRFEAQHVRQTIQHIQAMGLANEDIVYVSPMVESNGSEYADLVAAAGGRPVSPAAIHRQCQTFKAALHTPHSPSPKVSLYHIEEFIY